MKWLERLFSRRRRYEDLSVSIHEHLEEKIDELVDAGMSRDDAMQKARREFGNVALIEQRSREAWQWPTTESIWADVKFASRQLRKSPGFTAAALITLGLGIGADAAVFSLFDTVFLHPLPYRDPASLMQVTEAEPGQGKDEFGVAIQEAQDYQSRTRTFAEMGTFESGDFNLTDEGEPLRVNSALVSPSVFPLLGVSPVLGRTFVPEEGRYGNHHVAVLSSHLWKSKYGGDPNILGKTIKLDEAPYQVIGVMPASFRFPFDGKPLSERADIWVPDAVAPTRLNPQNRLMEFGVGLIGRLKPGVPEAAARSEMTQIARGFQREHSDVYSGTLQVEPRTYAFAGYSMQKARPLTMLLMTAVTCVLLIACANVANLLLARASRRKREISIRAAVGETVSGSCDSAWWRAWCWLSVERRWVCRLPKDFLFPCVSGGPRIYHACRMLLSILACSFSPWRSQSALEFCLGSCPLGRCRRSLPRQRSRIRVRWDPAMMASDCLTRLPYLKWRWL